MSGAGSGGGLLLAPCLAPCLALLLLLLLASVAVPTNAAGRRFLQSFAGPYWVFMEKMYECPGTDQLRNRMGEKHTRVLNIPRTAQEQQRISARATLFSDWSDEYSLTAEIATWANNEWKENSIAAMRFPNFACSAFRKFVPDYTRKLFAVNPTGPCVIPVGDYSMNNTYVNWTFPGFERFIYGRYLGKVTFHRSKEKIYCFAVEGQVIPLAS